MVIEATRCNAAAQEPTVASAAFAELPLSCIGRCSAQYAVQATPLEGSKRMQQKHSQVKSAHFATAGSQVKGDSRGALLRDHGSKEAQEMQSNSMRSKPSVSPNFTLVKFSFGLQISAYCFKVAVGSWSHSKKETRRSGECLVRPSAHIKLVGTQWYRSDVTTSWMARILTRERLSLRFGVSLTTTS